MKRAVPKGYRHIWKYHGRWDETKVRPGLWRFTFEATKGRKHKTMGSFKPGTKGAWLIKAKQYIQKTGRDTYQTKMVGIKKPLKFYIKR